MTMLDRPWNSSRACSLTAAISWSSAGSGSPTYDPSRPAAIIRSTSTSGVRWAAAAMVGLGLAFGAAGPPRRRDHRRRRGADGLGQASRPSASSSRAISRSSSWTTSTTALPACSRATPRLAWTSWPVAEKAAASGRAIEVSELERRGRDASPAPRRTGPELHPGARQGPTTPPRVYPSLDGPRDQVSVHAGVGQVAANTTLALAPENLTTLGPFSRSPQR